ncbi:hypothetical protein RA11412_2710 [Rothia aeria]|uniref:Uncharacterized protein n=1 Tax=Rothia aeria TaxID=172042 RepID=A0A2Z5R4Z7_9MICC|nr:hypothetical protein RA11412_2710 [Rothia aeria]
MNEGAEGTLRQHILEAIHQRVRWRLNPGELVGSTKPRCRRRQPRPVVTPGL